MHKKRLPILGSPLIHSCIAYFSLPELVARARSIIPMLHMVGLNDNVAFNAPITSTSLSDIEMSLHGRE